MTENEEEDLSKKPLDPQEQRFADNFLITLNKAEAARAAKYADASARQTGYSVYNRLNVKAYIEEKLREATLTAEQNRKIISDLANVNTSKYYKNVSRVVVKQIKLPLKEYILRKLEYIRREKEYGTLVQMGVIERKHFDKHIKSLESEIVRLEIELRANPQAYRIVDSEPALVKEKVLDINKIVADNVRIKKHKVGRDGVEIEFYSALDASNLIAKITGDFSKDNEQLKPTITNVVNLGSGSKPDETIYD